GGHPEQRIVAVRAEGMLARGDLRGVVALRADHLRGHERPPAPFAGPDDGGGGGTGGTGGAGGGTGTAAGSAPSSASAPESTSAASMSATPCGGSGGRIVRSPMRSSKVTPIGTSRAIR